MSLFLKKWQKVLHPPVQNIQVSDNQELFIYKCHQLVTFANSLEPDQAQHFVGPNLDPNCLTLYSDGILEEIFQKKLIWKKNQQTTIKHAKFRNCQRVKENVKIFLQAE